MTPRPGIKNPPCAVRRHRRYEVVLATWLSLIVSVGHVARADTAVTREHRIKSAIVFKLAKYVDWPQESFDGAQATLTLCAFGKGPMAAALSEAAGRSVQQRQVAVRSIDAVPGQAAGCHVIYIPDTQARQLPAVLSWARGRAVLSVSDIDGFASLGGVVGLVRRHNRIGFEINHDAVQRAGLMIRAQLLELATVIRDSD